MKRSRELFAQRSKRDIRRVVTALVREPFRRAKTVERLAGALVDAEHGRALIDAVAEVEEDTGIHALIVDAVAQRRTAAEALAVEILTETPLPG